MQFDRLMNDHAVIPYYQPIIDMRTTRVVGQEVLARSRLYGLETPLAMFEVADQLDLSVELSRMLRWEGIRYFAALVDPLPLFVNTHPSELSSPGLIDSLKEIRKVSPRQPLVLEIHEAAATNASSMRDLRAAASRTRYPTRLRRFCAGESRLMELIEEPPDFLKFDINLVRDLDASRKSPVVVGNPSEGDTKFEREERRRGNRNRGRGRGMSANRLRPRPGFLLRSTGASGPNSVTPTADKRSMEAARYQQFTGVTLQSTMQRDL